MAPSPIRMKENSPTWARLAEMVSAVRTLWPNRRTMAKAATDLPMTMTKMVASTASGSRSKMVGSNSMPTETKKSTAKASCSGRVSLAALWLRWELFITTPAKKAPRAKETPNSLTAPKAIPREQESTARVKSSREPVAAVRASIQGMRRRPPMVISAMKAATLARVKPRSQSTWDRVRALPPVCRFASMGSSTRASTITRSSTMSQPMAMRPSLVSSCPRLSSARSSTTVLAVESASPNTRPAVMLQPSNWERPSPSRVARVICTMAPGMAMCLTESRSFREKCRPTPNINRMTPISANSGASLKSAT
ncbi:hypothetical protein D3C71_1383370 [compost metagenome]